VNNKGPWELPRQPWELPRQPWELPRQPWEAAERKGNCAFGIPIQNTQALRRRSSGLTKSIVWANQMPLSHAGLRASVLLLGTRASKVGLPVGLHFLC
jgi:hypothetical protein